MPFLFIFNTDLLLIDVTFLQGILVFVVATIAMLIFAAATQGCMIARNRWYESILLLLVAFTLFRPAFWMDRIDPPYETLPGSQFEEVLGQAEAGADLKLRMRIEDDFGDPLETFMLVSVPEGEDGEERLANLGLEVFVEEDRTIVDMVEFGSQADDLNFDFDQEIGAEWIAKEWMWILALGVFALVVMLQRRRRDRQAATASS